MDPGKYLNCRKFFCGSITTTSFRTLFYYYCPHPSCDIIKGPFTCVIFATLLSEFFSYCVLKNVFCTFEIRKLLCKHTLSHTSKGDNHARNCSKSARVNGP